jgi:hypothetical protein
MWRYVKVCILSGNSIAYNSILVKIQRYRFSLTQKETSNTSLHAVYVTVNLTHGYGLHFLVSSSIAIIFLHIYLGNSIIVIF